MPVAQSQPTTYSLWLDNLSTIVGKSKKCRKMLPGHRSDSTHTRLTYLHQTKHNLHFNKVQYCVVKMPRYKCYMQGVGQLCKIPTAHSIINKMSTFLSQINTLSSNLNQEVVLAVILAVVAKIWKLYLLVGISSARH